MEDARHLKIKAVFGTAFVKANALTWWDLFIKTLLFVVCILFAAHFK
jgi:hypothetical protein